MAPKGKKGKKAQDDWENEAGEDIAQTNGGETEGAQPAAPEEAGEDDLGGGGGLLAALKKNKEKRKKKGKQDNSFVEGEDLAAIVNGDGNAEDPTTNGDALANKAPEEATFDDDEFSVKGNKKGKKGPAAKAVEEDDDDDSIASGATGGGVKSKKEKEKERKEREKQRKREQVSAGISL